MSTDKIPGGLAKGMSLSDIAKHHKLPLKSLQSKLEQGIKTEMEHTTDKAIAREIAMDHIYEDPNYYSKLKQIETEGTCGYTMDAETGEELETPGGLEEGDKRGLDMYALELQKGLEEAILNHLLNEKDPKTGTGKKPKGSGRRLYTDEDPSDTVTYPFEVTDRTYDDEDDSLISVSYELTTPYNSYKVEFYSGEYSPESKKFDLSFGVNIGYLNKIDTFQMTGEGNAKKIFNTILNIVEDFINKEDVKKIVVDGTDEKRKRIYKAIFSSTPPNISDKIELKEANLKGTMTFRNWTDSLNEDISKGTNQIYHWTSYSACKKIKEASDPQAGTAIPYGSGYKQLIPEITKFMLDKGMNLRPLPKVKFIEDDKKNAQDILGRTAFYNPEEKSVTLYTLGRHPKDILRSFCHEMIHHLQNVEDRLPKFYTTNTQEDSALNDIEEEAHRLGSMTMREFEDTIKK
jgi:hypothetical protein